MKKRSLLILSVGLCLLLTGCGGKKNEEPAPAEPAAQTTPAEQKVDEDGNVILDEYFEESGTIEAENTEEETGEVVNQVEVDFTIETQSDILKIETSNGGYTDGTWKYLVTDENIVALDSEEDLENGGKIYNFKANNPGDAVIGISYFLPDDESDISIEDVEEGLTDVSVDVRVNSQMKIGLRS